MSEIELLNLMLPTMGFIVLIFFGFLFMKEWRSGRERDFRMRIEELDLKRQEKTAPSKININNEVANSDSDLGGYITLELPEERKAMFQDILKGFEEYSLLKGYKVSISTDSSELNRISFKITILDFGITANRSSVKDDLNEYINKIQDGDIDSDIPEIINPIDHARIVMALKNRITFLQQNYEVEKNIKEFYQGFIEKLPLNSFSHGNPIFHISNTGALDMDKRKYISNNSANVMQGDNHQNTVQNNTITIGATVNEKNGQVDKLLELIQVLSISKDNDEHIKAIRSCENIKDELLDEESPDEGMIEKWLNKINSVMSNVKKGSELFTKMQSVLESFGF